MSTVVYRASDAEGHLLYVGSSVNVDERLRYHSVYAPWWTSGLTIIISAFDTIAEARAAELVAIRDEHPTWNIHGRSANHPDGPAYDYDDVARLHAYRETEHFHRHMGHTAVKRRPAQPVATGQIKAVGVGERNATRVPRTEVAAYIKRAAGKLTKTDAA